MYFFAVIIQKEKIKINKKTKTKKTEKTNKQTNKQKKRAIFHILKTIGIGGNMITSQMGYRFCIKFWSGKYTFTCQRRHFQAC